MRKFLREYFLLSKKERNGLLILTIILLSVIVLPEIYIKFSKQNSGDFETQLLHIKKGMPTDDEILETPDLLFDFDPNTASASELASLGFSVRSIQHIENYRNKGGVFYSRDDLLKINDVSKEDYFNIRKFIKIKNNHYNQNSFNNKPSLTYKIDLNKADSSEVTKLKGIGPVYASRIIKYRKSIQGFSSIDQLSEVYGIEAELVQQLRPFLILSKPEMKDMIIGVASTPVKIEKQKINLNRADTIELMKLRGIGPAFSKRIFKYRTLLGGFVHIDQLKEVYGLSEETIESIMPDLLLEPETIVKININKATYGEMSAHPYINKLLAEYIIKHRSKMVFTAVSDIKNSILVDDELYRKLAPYLEI